MMSKKSKWNDDYLRFGFACIGNNRGFAKPKCMLWENVFSTTNWKLYKLYKLKENFDNRHGGPMLWALIKNPCQRKERVLILEQPFHKFCYLMASYQVAFKAWLCEAEAQAMLDDWSWSQKLSDMEAGDGSWNLGSGSTALVCLANELYK